jgi:hypothetical protein
MWWSVRDVSDDAYSEGLCLEVPQGPQGPWLCYVCNDVQTFFWGLFFCSTLSDCVTESITFSGRLFMSMSDLIILISIVIFFMPLRLRCFAVFWRSSLTDLNEDVAQCTAEAVILSPCFTKLAPKGFNYEEILSKAQCLTTRRRRRVVTHLVK